MSLSAAREEPLKSPACARCFITSVGMRIRHAAVSASEEARMLIVVCDSWVALGLEGAFGGERVRLTPSYTTKKDAAEGMEPRSADGRPAYMERIVPVVEGLGGWWWCECGGIGFGAVFLWCRGGRGRNLLLGLRGRRRGASGSRGFG